MSQLDYQDPILTPGNLREIVQNLPGKIKHEHSSYHYDCDSDTFENELNEFFQYNQVIIQLQEYRILFEKETSNLKQLDREYIMSLLDKLEFTEQEPRLNSCKILAYISLGCFTTNKNNELKQDRIKNIIKNNELLYSCGAFHIFYLKLQQLCAIKEKDSSSICIEIELYTTLLYVLIEVERYQYRTKSGSSKKFKQELVSTEPNLTEFLLNLVAQSRDRLPDTLFPLKKVVLLLWKSLLFMSGGLVNIKSISMTERERLGLKPKNNRERDLIAKCTPQDLKNYRDEITKKYPGHTLPKHYSFEETLLKNNHNDLVINVSPYLSSAMGYTKATNNVELPYQTLFPPKLSSNNNGILNDKKQNQQLQNYFMESTTDQETSAVALPLTQNGFAIPESIKEAGEVYISNMYLSLANYQIVQERSNNIQKWTRQKQDHYQKNEQSTHSNNNDELFERIYAKTVHNLQNVVIVLLKLLLTSINSNKIRNSSNNDESDDSKKAESNSSSSSSISDMGENSITLEYIEQIDNVRDREIYAKSISGILIILLKWAKSSHVLKFEYISQLLADSGCLLLILKVIGLQDVADLVKTNTDVPYYSFLDYNLNREANTTTEKEIKGSSSNRAKDSGEIYTNRRNMYWAINYLRILQMLTKNKTHRTMLLTQYKSSVILKRLLRISHPILELYVFKLIKNQVPYLGKKWRSQNMKIISSIYLKYRTILNDDWMSRVNTAQDVEEGKIQESHMRILTRIYNGDRYLPSLLPLHDELISKKKSTMSSTPTGPGFYGFTLYNMDAMPKDDDDSVYLEKDFLENYEEWLQDEVYDVVGEEQQDLQVETPAPIMTPYPESINTKTTDNFISHEELTFEINKLYIEQLNAEFKSSPPLKNLMSSSFSSNSLHSYEPSTPVPTLNKKLTPLAKYTGDENSLTYVKRSNSSKSDNRHYFSIQEIENNYMQIEDQLLQHLMQVEDKTIQEWIGSKKLITKRGGEEKESVYNFEMLDGSSELFFDDREEEVCYNSSSTNTSDESEENNYYYLLNRIKKEERTVTFSTTY